MGAYSSAVGHHRCHVWVLGELFEHISPNTVLFPACEALEYTVPLSISVRQFTPLGAGAQNPVNCLNETSTLFLLPCVGTRVSLQKRIQFLPLMVGNSLCRHPPIVAKVTKLIKRQRDLVQRNRGRSQHRLHSHPRPLHRRPALHHGGRNPHRPQGQIYPPKTVSLDPTSLPTNHEVDMEGPSAVEPSLWQFRRVWSRTSAPTSIPATHVPPESAPTTTPCVYL